MKTPAAPAAPAAKPKWDVNKPPGVARTAYGTPFSNTLGPYDHWAIEYAYKPLTKEGEAAELARIAARSTVFVYRKTKFSKDQLPKSIMDLAKPEWKGRWAAAQAGADFQAIVSAMLELKGEAATLAWLKSMKENVVPFKGNSIAMKAVNAGQVDGAVIYHYYYYGDMAKTGENSEKVGLHYFRNEDPGAFVSISGGGVLASSKHKAEAQAFVKWITGKGGQEILRTGSSYEYAVGQGAASHRSLVPLADLQAPKVEPAKLNSRKVSDLMTQAGLL